MATTPTDFKALAQKHGATTSIHESELNSLPPEIMRIESAVGAQLVPGKPYGDAIASVADNEPHRIEVNNPTRFAQGPAQTLAHETTHLWQNQLPGPLQKAIPPDNQKAPYDLSNIDQLRAQGRTLATLPHEQAAAIIQTFTADPSQRARLQPWIDDLNKTPLSVMNPTDPNQKGINTTVRPPVPPLEAYSPLHQLKTKAAELQAKFAQSGLAPHDSNAPQSPANTSQPLYMAVPKPKGLKKPGNININDRPIVPNGKESSTVLSTSIGTDQGEVLIPRVSDGADGKPPHIMSEQEAIAYYKKTGKYLGIFDTPQDATAYANALHIQQSKLGNKNGRTVVK